MGSNSFLPLGSVVTLYHGTKKIMIIGRLQIEVNTNTLYDYAACYYPEGVLNPKELFLFNKEDIDQVYYVGMQDQEEFAFLKLLENQEK